GAGVSVGGLQLPAARQSPGERQLEAPVAGVVEIAHAQDLIEEEVVDVQVGPPVRNRLGAAEIDALRAGGLEDQRTEKIEGAALGIETQRVVDVDVLELLAKMAVDVGQGPGHLRRD